MFYNRNMRILKAFRFRLDLTPSQALLFAKTAGCCRLLHNLGLVQCSMAWRQQRKSVVYADQARELKALKAEFPWFKEVPHHCLQQALMDLQRAFGNFFRGRAGYPRRHKKFRRDSFRFPDPAQIKLDGSRLVFPAVLVQPSRWITPRPIIGFGDVSRQSVHDLLEIGPF